MKIGVISDTHIPERAKELPSAIFSAFKGVELILHAGDLIELSVLDKLKEICPVKAVYGNMDSQEVKNILTQKEIIELGRFKIGIIHGWGSPDRLIETVKKEFPQKISVIIFGHSHNPINQLIGETLFFNPGSPTDRIFSVFNSYGILHIDDKITGEIIKI